MAPGIFRLFRRLFRRGGQTAYYKYGVLGTMNARNLRKMVFHLLKNSFSPGAIMVRRGYNPPSPPLAPPLNPVVNFLNFLGSQTPLSCKILCSRRILCNSLNVVRWEISSILAVSCAFLMSHLARDSLHSISLRYTTVLLGQAGSQALLKLYVLVSFRHL